MKTQEYGCLFVNICISDALAMAAKITLKIAVVAVCLAETWITAAMTVRSVQTVPSTGNDMNQDSDYNTTPVPVTCGLHNSSIKPSLRQIHWFFNRTIAKKCRPWGCHFVHMQANSRLWSCKSSGHGEFMEYLGPFSRLRSQFCSASLLSKMGQDEAAMIWLQKSAAQARG